MLIDKEGRLFGKVNLIDFFLLLGFILVFAVCLKFFVLR